MTHTARPQEEIAIKALYEKKIRECKENRIKAAKVKKDSHPRYEAMTDEEFKQHKIENIRFWRDKGNRYEAEYKKFQEDHIVYE